MKFKTKDIEINYIDYGQKTKQPILFLHGWGQNIEMMKILGDYFQNNYRIIIPDLPGFGKSSEPKYPFTVYDYVESIKKLLDYLKVEKPIIVGHSFGGKISIVYSSKYSVSKLVLLASPFKINKEKMTLFTKTLKMLIKVPGLKTIGNKMKKYLGSSDYKNSSEVMREVLVKTVNLNVVNEAKMIKCPTIIMWGTNDTVIGIENAYELEEYIKDSAVIKLEGCTHYAYLERINEVVNILNVFFEGGQK